jgi:signal transduction histidine kinase/DNA-binding response OmpR family regulator
MRPSAADDAAAGVPGPSGSFSGIVLLALLYFSTGRLGLELAVPPGYATLLWPPSGLAAGALLLYGPRLWPGIFIGSFLLNCWVGFTPETIDPSPVMATAAVIAAGATLQALAARWLSAHFLGLPLQVLRAGQMFRLLLLCGPVACVIAALTGSTLLYFTQHLSTGEWQQNLLSWWLGDVLGVAVFLPLMLLFAGGRAGLRWNNSLTASLPFIYVIAIIIPLGLTFYVWKILSEKTYQQAHAEFEAMTLNNETALLSRMESYGHALIGGLGYYQNVPQMTREKWNRYASVIPLETDFPGINGIGVIDPVRTAALKAYEQRARADDAPDFTIHPACDQEEHFVIRYIFPEDKNAQAIGLDISFEENRRNAANLSRDSGHPAITQKIKLVQDATSSSGFLMFHPVYLKDRPVVTVQQRRAAFLGWIYAPFIAPNLFSHLSDGQGRLFTLEVYDGDQPLPEQLIYRTAGSDRHPASRPAYQVSRSITMMQQNWLLVWSSTPTYDQQQKNSSAIFVLAGGLLFTGLFALLLLLFSLQHRLEDEEQPVRLYAVPGVVFLLSVLAVFVVYQTMQNREESYLRSLLEGQLERATAVLSIDTRELLTALQRMGERWNAAGGTSTPLWQKDAQHYVTDFEALKVVALSDATHHVRQIVPQSEYSKYIGFDLAADEERQQVLAEAMRGAPYTLSIPRDYAQEGFLGMSVYLPLQKKGAHAGFIVATVAVDTLFRQMLRNEGLQGNHSIRILYQDQVIYHSGSDNGTHDPHYLLQKPLKLANREYTLQLMPSRQYVDSLRGYLPLALLAGGLGVAFLLAFTTRAIMLAQIRATKLHAAMDKAEKATHAKSLFLSNISHEIRTPLNGVLATAELFSTTPLDELQRKYVGIIRRSGELLLHLLNDVLDLSKIEMQKLSLVEQPFRLRDATEEAVELFMSAAAQKDLSLKLEYDSSLPEQIIGDMHRYTQILTNLTGNAVKYTREGGITVAVFRSVQEDDRLCVEVRDTGIGIPQSAIAEVFDRFTQAHHQARIEGTGLGLAICKSLVELMGGQIQVESEEGVGSIFRFTIPMRIPTQAAADAEQQVTVVPGAFRGVRVLLAEDVEVSRQIIQGMLEYLGCHVITAVNGAEAVEYCTGHHFDMVFMDCNMPVMNGYDATRALREQHGPSLPVIAVSAHAFVQDMEECYNAGMDDYLQKPVRMQDLASALARWSGKAADDSDAPQQADAADPAEALLPRDATSRLKLLDMMRRSATELRTELEEALDAGQTEEATRAAHSLKSVAAQISQEALRQNCLAIEQAGRNDQPKDMLRHFSAFPDAFATFIQAIERLEASARTQQENG